MLEQLFSRSRTADTGVGSVHGDGSSDLPVSNCISGELGGVGMSIGYCTSSSPSVPTIITIVTPAKPIYEDFLSDSLISVVPTRSEPEEEASSTQTSTRTFTASGFLAAIFGIGIALSFWTPKNLWVFMGGFGFRRQKRGRKNRQPQREVEAAEGVAVDGNKLTNGQKDKGKSRAIHNEAEEGESSTSSSSERTALLIGGPATYSSDLGLDNPRDSGIDLTNGEEIRATRLEKLLVHPEPTRVPEPEITESEMLKTIDEEEEIELPINESWTFADQQPSPIPSPRIGSPAPQAKHDSPVILSRAESPVLLPQVEPEVTGHDAPYSFDRNLSATPAPTPAVVDTPVTNGYGPKQPESDYSLGKSTDFVEVEPEVSESIRRLNEVEKRIEEVREVLAKVEEKVEEKVREKAEEFKAGPSVSMEVEAEVSKVEVPKVEEVVIPVAVEVEIPQVKETEIPKVEHVEAPKAVETPKVEPTEAPKVEPTEPPKVELVEAPKVELVEVPKVQPKVELEVEPVESPKVELVEAPKTAIPEPKEVEIPKVEVPKAEVVVEIPEVKKTEVAKPIPSALIVPSTPQIELIPPTPAFNSSFSEEAEEFSKERAEEGAESTTLPNVEEEEELTAPTKAPARSMIPVTGSLTVENNDKEDDDISIGDQISHSPDQISLSGDDQKDEEPVIESGLTVDDITRPGSGKTPSTLGDDKSTKSGRKSFRRMPSLGRDRTSSVDSMKKDKPLRRSLTAGFSSSKKSKKENSLVGSASSSQVKLGELTPPPTPPETSQDVRPVSRRSEKGGRSMSWSNATSKILSKEKRDQAKKNSDSEAAGGADASHAGDDAETHETLKPSNASISTNDRPTTADGGKSKIPRGTGWFSKKKSSSNLSIADVSKAASAVNLAAKQEIIQSTTEAAASVDKGKGIDKIPVEETPKPVEAIKVIEAPPPPPTEEEQKPSTQPAEPIAAVVPSSERPKAPRLKSGVMSVMAWGRKKK